ncbi:Uncharacterized membrane protein [Micromonospora sediminicola]|uniref:Uncharacterized membrane protein n=1 Tax=Micromonospora sediminicola TaxID=946078 RepID=A0A1A9B822_9ACTN|nr:Uncharacterized membrane protein [Micromonospora sediminicola]
MAALAISLIPIWARFYAFNPHIGRLSPAEHPWYFPTLMVHVAACTLAILTGVLQVWPGLRVRYPRLHVRSGRIYVFAGILPAAGSVLVISAYWPYSPFTVSSDILSSLLWLAFTGYGLVLARQGRIDDHRRWMLRSFALTASNVLNQFLGIPLGWIFKPQLNTTFGGNEELLMQVWTGVDVWLGWVLALLAVEWYLEREQLRRSARRRAAMKRRERRPTDPAEMSAANRLR